MSQFKNNANPANLQLLLQQDNYNGNHFVSYVRANSTQSTANLTLTAGYYYFEIVNVNYGGTGYFKVIVDTPSLFNNKINPTWQIDSVVVKPSQFDAQIWTVKVFGASGSFDIFYYDSIGNKYTATNTIGASAATFKDNLGYIPDVGNYGPDVVRDTLDAAGNPTTTPSLV